jgi:hypothetical protein
MNLKTIINIKAISRLCIGYALLLFPIVNYAQKDTIDEKVNWSGYIETYYTAAHRSNTNGIAPFIFNHSKSQSIALNLGLVKASVVRKNYRASIALHSGTYVNANYDQSLGTLRFINEAQVGMKLTKNGRLWLDAGIMPSHIGAESAIGQDNLTLTRSLMAELSPYYETGAKLTYSFGNGKGSAGIIASNGWQVISNESGNTPAWGTLFNYKLNARWEVNHNTFYGKAPSGLFGEMDTRFYNNVYVKYSANKLNFLLSYDIGRQASGQKIYKVKYWTAFAIIAKYKFAKNVSVSYRIENFKDKNSAIPIEGNYPELEHNILGNSLNVDYTISEEAMFRIENKWLSASELLFKQGKSINFTTISLSVKL